MAACELFAWPWVILQAAESHGRGQRTVPRRESPLRTRRRDAGGAANADNPTRRRGGFIALDRAVDQAEDCQILGLYEVARCRWGRRRGRGAAGRGTIAWPLTRTRQRDACTFATWIRPWDVSASPSRAAGCQRGFCPRRVRGMAGKTVIPQKMPRPAQGVAGCGRVFCCLGRPVFRQHSRALSWTRSRAARSLPLCEVA